MIVNDQELSEARYRAIAGDFLAKDEIKQNPSDVLLKRSLIRHDAQAVCRALLKEVL